MSSSSDHTWIYDVFISFRGEDTRNNFVSHLYAALTNAGINTFVDDENLRKGEALEPALDRAIEGSKISIVVFSENYAESSWCLNELVNIMGCRKTYGQVVIPIFYGVEPSDVRKQKGNIGNALKHIARERKYLLSNWKRALTDIANLSGWDVTNFRTDGEMIKKLVEDILSKLDISLLSITESHVQKITEFIDDQSSKVCIIGIWGMGGSGKTTTAKAVYNRIHHRFKGRTSFIESIREVCDNNRKGIIHLQQQLLSDLLKIKQDIHSIALGITKIGTRLRGQIAFVVLDDVTKFEQLKALCGNPKLFGSGSVLIVTTRDVRLLNSLKVDYVFTMMEMDKNQSLELFSWHCFRQPSPEKAFSELSRNVVSYCRGLPLALEVLGSYLSERTKQERISALSKLEKIPNDQVQQKLRISYDGLEDHTLKDIFLDICCFFIGKNRADVTEILNGCGLHADIGISVLIERSLIKVEKNNKLQMHDLLRDMGRAIVSESSAKEPAKHSRLWFCEDVLEVLSKNTLLQKLKVLNLSHSKYLKSTPDFSKLPNLEKLIMKDCQSLSNVHSTIGDLKNILLINLKDCTSLENLPREIYQLKSVKTLVLSGCSKIEKLEEDIVQMESLTSLIATDTSIKEVPYSILTLKSIGYISLCGYEGLSHDVFPSLIRFWMSPTINTLPRIPPFGSMPLSLVSLDVENNNNLGLSCLLPKLNSLSELRSFRVQCHSKIQLTRELRSFLGDLDDANITELETSHTSQISVLSLRSLLIGIGSYHTVINTLGKSISQELRTNDSIDSFLPGDNYPSWLAYTCVGPSVHFQVPEDSVCGMKGITLCVVYSSTLENMGTECLTSVLIINHTKSTIQIYKRDTIMSFNDEDWQGVVSNLGVGDNVEIFVTFGNGLTVMETAVYLIYGQSTTMEIEPILEVKAESSSEVEAQPSPDVKAEPSYEVEPQPSPDVTAEPSSEVEAQPSLDVIMEPLSNPNKKIFIRLAKKVGKCLCLNQN